MKYSLLVLLFLIVGRTGFTLILFHKEFIPANYVLTILKQGINYDYLFTSSFFVVTVIVHYCIKYFSSKFANILILGLSLSMLITNMLLLSYILINTELLGYQIISYSIKEIIYIISTSITDASSLMILPVVIIVFIFFMVCSMKWRFKKPKVWTVLFVILFIIGATQLKYINPNENLFKSSAEYKYSHNPTSYLLESIFIIKTKEKRLNQKTIEKAVAFYQKNLNHQSFVNSDYPFLRTYNDTPQLNSLIDLNSKPPNIVVLIVESLSRSFCGKNSRFQGFTPFLDSLNNQSLSWEYFYSNCSRTYGVMPNLFCSAPNGKGRGFMNNPDFIPQHLSLIKLLNNEGYESNFYYGGWGNFDNTRSFLIKQGVDNIISKNDFDKKFSSAQSKWGYKDEALFSQYFDLTSKKTNTKPRLDVLLTLSIHSPFDQAPNSYNTQIDSISQLNVDSAIILANKNVFKTILYADDCIKNFINNYKKRADYDNTIFVITGDHNVQALPLIDELDRFHVPFMIYSPMIKYGKNLNTIASHLDFAPTLWSTLTHKYDFYKPTTVPWLGTGLRLKKEKNSYFVPLNDLPNMGHGLTDNAFIIEDKIYKIKNGRVKEQVVDNNLKQLMKSYFTLNEYVCEENKLSK